MSENRLKIESTTTADRLDLPRLDKWLDEHPKATATIDHWTLTIVSPDAEDMIGLGHFDCPADPDAAVEGHYTCKTEDGQFEAHWQFA